MSGGPSNNDRFEQIGQSWLKHAFAGIGKRRCGFGCNTVGVPRALIYAPDVPILTAPA